MTRALTVLLLVGSALLGVWIWSVLATPASLAEPAPSARQAPATVAAVHDDGQRRREQVATILGRPVFSSTRRPKQDQAAPQPAAAPITALPRMSAILINGTLRSAIFDGDGKATVLGEGGRLGPFTIQSIGPQAVTIIGPNGTRVVRPAFSNNPPPAMTTAPAMLPQVIAPPPPVQVVLPAGMPNPVGAAR